MKLMKDTGSLMNWIMDDNGKTTEIKVGDGVAELMWSDRNLYRVVRIEGKKIIVRRVVTAMRDWTEGTEYPKTDANGEWLLEGGEYTIELKYKKWRMDGSRVSLAWGATTGYRDPSF